MSTTVDAVMIHGAGGGGWEYDAWQSAFAAAGFAVHAPDLIPNAEAIETTLFSDYLQQVISWTDPLTNPVIVGASMGAVLALKIAERVSPCALVLVNPMPPMGLTSALDLQSYPSVVRYRGRPAVETALALLDSDDETIARATTLWRDESGAVLNTVSRGVAADRPRCPVLIVIGSEDREVPPATSQALARSYKADVQVYPGMSHVGPLLGMRAGVVAHSVVGWLSGVLRNN